MSAEPLRPAARKARRQRTWRAVGLIVFGIAWSVFAVVSIGLVLDRCEEESNCDNTRLPALLVVVGPGAVWAGVVAARDARVLRKPGRVYELRPAFAERRKRRWVWGVWPRSTVETRAWLVFATERGIRLAIPVSESNAVRALPRTNAVVRGSTQVGGRVVLDFPEEVIWPTGRVEAAPNDAQPGPQQRVNGRQ